MGGHGHAMGTPHLSLRGMGGKINAMGKEAWAPQHECCLRSDTSSALARTRLRKAAHRRV